MTDERQRWRMTFDELRFLCDAGPLDIDKWAQLGAFGPRIRERRDRGWHRHVTREIAQRAVIMSALCKSRVDVKDAARAAATHEVDDMSELIVLTKAGVTIALDRSELILP